MRVLHQQTPSQIVDCQVISEKDINMLTYGSKCHANKGHDIIAPESSLGGMINRLLVVHDCSWRDQFRKL